MPKSKVRFPTALRDKEHKLTRILLIIFGCFIAYYGPGMVFKLVSIWNNTKHSINNQGN